jgi:hypothetical protein
MGLGGDRFGVGVNWLQRPASVDDDEGRAPLVRGADLPPMFGPNSGVHRGGETVVESIESLETENGIPEADPQAGH